MKVLIVDDEQNARENLKIILEDFFPGIELIGLADSVKSAKEIISFQKPDLVFLDVNMPEANGFKLLENNDYEFEVVFVTAHSEYALQAIKASAIDYIEKPLNIEDLNTAIDKVRKKLSLGEEQGITEQKVKEIVRETMENNSSKITIPTSNGLALVDYKDIIHLEATDGYTYIHLTGGRKFLSSKNIKIYEEKLDEQNFFRIHKSHIINISHHLKEYSRTGGNIAVLSNDAEIPISRRKLPSFLNRLAAI